MAAQRTEKEETAEFKVVPETTTAAAASPLSLSSPPPRRFTARSAAVAPPARGPIRESHGGADVAAPAEVRRCAGCRKRVGLTGFRCRCGDLYCSEHRYSDRHVCGFDYKAAGREMIAKENPVVKAAKIIRL